ncbi:iron-sulfur cluster assembly scaffold protein [Aestuariibius sp. HNIBRBA575]|uniref:iron-sulfur cluster assembly scaffold protein n=1 Tax=Aestuariibius sp. HNIBRBA575 TaxID=3233343 RepID=UPI0034A5C6DB
MTAETDLIKLYSGQILALATDMPLTGHLEAPQHSAKKRAPLCGSTVSVDLNMTDGLISDYRQDVKACALGQASASVFASHVIGKSLDDIQTLRDQLFAMLTADGPVPDAPFDGYQVLIPAREYKNRHASILLAIDATLSALKTT